MEAGAHESDNPRLAPGKMIAERYRLDRCIGRGGMGSIWAAKHTGLHQHVAIKFINPIFAQSAEARGRFDREAKASARLRSRYVVQVFDNGELSDGTPFIVMELLEGQSLADRIEAQGPLPMAEAVRIMSHVGKALAHAHAQRIIHRDIKPENIFLSRSVDDDLYIAKVVDFGVAKVTTESITHTAAGAVVGSPLYMSPEQARGLKTVDHRADIYSLGATAFTALTGRPVYTAENLADLLMKICDEDERLPNVSDYANVPSSVDSWFRACCAGRPRDRYQSVKEAIAALVVASGVSAEEGSIQNFVNLDEIRRAALERESALPVPLDAATVVVRERPDVEVDDDDRMPDRPSFADGPASVGGAFHETMDLDITAKIGRPLPPRPMDGRDDEQPVPSLIPEFAATSAEADDATMPARVAFAEEPASSGNVRPLDVTSVAGGIGYAVTGDPVTGSHTGHTVPSKQVRRQDRLLWLGVTVAGLLLLTVLVLLAVLVARG